MRDEDELAFAAFRELLFKPEHLSVADLAGIKVLRPHYVVEQCVHGKD